MLHIIEHSVLDSLKLVPFLFLTYLVMEYLEHKAGDKTQKVIGKAGKLGPLLGGVLGAAPQCGFSTAASNLYAGRVISMGTLLAVYLSTSDEMLPILISAKAEPALIVKILLLKVLIGMAAGFLVDFLFAGKQKEHHHIHEMCEEQNCHCEEGILRSAINHTVRITFFILLITFALNLVMHNVGEDALASLLRDHGIVGPILSGLVGLIPNCASSVVITQLYLEGAMSFGTMMAGLLVGAGVGVLVLCKVNHNRKENLQIIGLLYLIGVVSGIVLG
ncbi:MAG: arsenic efflux protein [Lachnospiraceae bacterium]|nr:arsenic efflux protein [Lachnospiraceae bacterium]